MAYEAIPNLTTLIAPSYTTTQRDALIAIEGMIILNTTDTKLQAYVGGSWVDLH